MNAITAAFVCLGCALAAPAWADEATVVPAAGRDLEPRVTRTIVEDEGARIEELRVRGQIQRITVTPKVGPKQGYEIITGDGSRDLSEGASSTRGAAGKRVWHVLSF